MNFTTIVTELFGDPLSGNAVVAVVLLSILQFAAGSIRAIANGSFMLTALSAWIRTDVAGRVLPILLIFITARAMPDLSMYGVPVESGLVAFGLLQAGSYIISAVASIKDNVVPPPPGLLKAKQEIAKAAGDTVPTA